MDTAKDRDENIAHLLTGRGRCTLLLVALVALIAIYPYFLPLPYGRLALNVLQLATILLGLFAVAGRGASFQVSALLAASVLTLYVHSLFTGLQDPYYSLRYFLNVGFYLIVAGRLMAYLLRKGPVTADKLHAAISIYLMTAVAWAMIYSVVFWVDRGAFVFAHRPPDGVSPAFYHFLYFSITTITATGYGDITPVTDQARSLVILEQLLGLFFMTVLIARLAGLYPQVKGPQS